MGANPVFRIFWFVQRLRVVSSWNLESRISDSLPNMWNHQMFQKSIFSTRARDHFWRDMGAHPVFRTFLFEVVRWWNLVCRYSKWPGVWLSGATVCSPAVGGFRFSRHRRAVCPGAKRLYYGSSWDLAPQLPKAGGVPRTIQRSVRTNVGLPKN